MNPDPRPRRIVVIGGGISGLAAAHRVLDLAAERSLPVDLQLLEAGPRLGGVIGSERRDGFVLEWGPDSFITDKPWALALCERLGLADQLIGTNDRCRRSFVAFRGRLQPIPPGFQVLAPSDLRALAATPLFSWSGKLRMVCELGIPPRHDEADESLGSFVERRLGAEALERLAEPLITGIYGADAGELSLEATLPRFRAMEREHGSVIRALQARRKQSDGAGVSGARYGLFASFSDGMQMLVDALAARLPEGSVRLGAAVVSVERVEGQDPTPPPPPPGTHEVGGGEGEPRELITRNSPLLSGEGPGVGSGAAPYVVTLADSQVIEADAVIVALPAHAAARVVAGLDAELGSLLGAIRYGSAATMNLAYRREAVPHPLDGFGFVVSAAERRSILGCTFASVKYPGRAPEGMALLRVFFGAANAEQEPATLERASRDDLRHYLGIEAEPLWTTCHVWPRAMPHYQVGHLERVARIEARAAALPGFALAGNAYRGIGIPDSIHSGETAAERVLGEVSPPPGLGQKGDE